MLVDSQHRVLVFRHMQIDGGTFWALPGGGLEAGESFEQAAIREAGEELGVIARSVRYLWTGVAEFRFEDHPIEQEEQYFILDADAPWSFARVAEMHKREGIVEARWWSAPELERTSETVFPRDLAAKLSASLPNHD